MRTSTLIRRLGWLAGALSACADDTGGADGEATGSSSGTSSVPTTGMDDASTGTDTASATGDVTSTAESSATVPSTDTGSSGLVDTSSSGDESSSGGGNTAPVATDDVLYTTQDSPFDVATVLLANDIDDDGDALTVVMVDAASARGGAVTIGVGDEVSYEPPPGFWGSDAFAYTISDGVAESSASATVYVAPINVPLSSVAAGFGGFTIDGETMGDNAGYSVSAVGDVDGDGLGDLVVGAPSAGPAGRSYVVFGKADTSPVDLLDVAMGNGGFVIVGDAVGTAGLSVSGGGDVNGDGLADVVVGDPSAPLNGNSGGAYVVFGKADTAAVALADVVMGGGGFVLIGAAEFDLSGQSVGGAGDVNGDGLGDLVVGSPGADLNGAYSGVSYVAFGKADTAAISLGDLVSGVGGFAIVGEVPGDSSGISVSGAGDINDDGLGDLVVGAYSAGDEITADNAGRSYVVYGTAETTTVELSDVAAGLGGFALFGEAPDDVSGRAVSGAGDVNGDGVADIIIGAHYADPGGDRSGRAYVVFGAMDTTSVDLADIAMGIGGFALDGQSSDDYAGRAVGRAGDINGDGLGDLIVGAEGAPPNGVKSGRVYVVYGKVDTGTVDLGDIAMGDGGFVLDGEAANDYAGRAVSGAGDVDGDGLGDLIVGAPYADPNGNGSGRSYVVFGVPTLPQ